MTTQHTHDHRPVILTGDRPTGPLHLGHYAGSLSNRVRLQDSHRQFLLLADAQALTDNFDDPEKVRRNLIEVTADYLAVGIDPDKTAICRQSALPALAELCFYFLNLVTLARLERNPTLREELKLRGFDRDVPAGFLVYPVSQAADILAFKADLVPVGADQLPVIEQAREIAARFNRLYAPIFTEPEALVPEIGRLPGIDGMAKMSKSVGNALALSASSDEIRGAVRAMYTDPGHIRAADPGKVEGNVVFTYLEAFDPEQAVVADMKAHYRRGGLGDTAVKQRLEEILQELLRPIRERRAALMVDRAYLEGVIRTGTDRARDVTNATMAEAREAMRLT
jgi:tryptophanyl-tRNA synthetase